MKESKTKSSREVREKQKAQEGRGVLCRKRETGMNMEKKRVAGTVLLILSQSGSTKTGNLKRKTRVLFPHWNFFLLDILFHKTHILKCNLILL